MAIAQCKPHPGARQCSTTVRKQTYEISSRTDFYNEWRCQRFTNAICRAHYIGHYRQLTYYVWALYRRPFYIIYVRHTLYKSVTASSPRQISNFLFLSTSNIGIYAEYLCCSNVKSVYTGARTNVTKCSFRKLYRTQFHW